VHPADDPDSTPVGTSYPRAGMEAILSGLQIILAVVVIVLVLLHSGKDAGLSGAFGVGTGAGSLGGGSLVERNLNRWTVAFAVLFVVNVIVLVKI
jgi:preprotein translocase subunit SecG